MNLYRLIFGCLLLLPLGFATVFFGCGDDDDDNDDNHADDDDSADDDSADDDDDDNDDNDDNDNDDNDDDEAPFIVSTIPADNATEVALSSTIVMTFSEPMDTTSVEENFNLGAQGGDFDWNANEDTLTFTPDSLLTEGQNYTIFIGSGAMDKAGNPLTASFSADFQTVDLWTMTFNDPDNENDLGNGIALDGEGNLYLVGSYTESGQEENIWIHAMDAAGTELWTRKVNGPASDTDNGNDIYVDGDRNVYVVGDIGQTVGYFDLWVRKYDSYTTEQWTRTYGDISLGYDYGNGIAVDGDGNVIVCGRTGVSGADWDILIRKYDPDGTIVWMRAYDGGLNAFDGCNDVTTDADGNIYTVGVVNDVTGEDTNIWVRKLDADGTPQWTKTCNGPQSMSDSGNGIALDADGNVYVTGSVRVSGQYANIWVRKYDNDGNVEWTATLDGDDHLSDEGRDIAVDSSGNVYVAGKSESSTEFSGAWVGKFDNGGTLLWQDIYQGADSGDDTANGIALDGNDNVYVVGTVYTDAQNRNIWLRKYDSDGHWAD